MAPPQQMTSPPYTLRASSFGLDILDAHGLFPVEEDSIGKRPADDGQVGTVFDRVQVSPRRTQPAPPVDIAVKGPEAFLSVAVDILREGVTRLLDRLEKGTEKGIFTGARFQQQGAIDTMVFIGTDKAGFRAFKVGQIVGVVPVLHTGILAPALIVHGIAANVDHAVDAARAAQHLAPPVENTPVVHVRFRFALVTPVIEFVAQRDRQSGRHVDEDIPDIVGASGLQHQHPVGRVGAEPVGQGAAGGTASHDDDSRIVV